MLRPIVFATLFSVGAAAQASADPLHDALRTRLEGDRTGACLAVAVIEGERVQRAFQCADATRPPPLGASSAFEIGSVTKTMTSVLLARFIADGRASLDDPLARHLPAGTRVPAFKGEPIRLRHLVTHTSGLPALPPGFAPVDMADPYAKLTPDALLAALAKTDLQRAPGERFEYSNFAMMLLSHVVTRLGGNDLETQLDARLFSPLGMKGAYIANAPPGVQAVQGHLSTGKAASAWNMHPDLAGVGGVRATLDDMVRYAQGYLAGSGDAALDAALARTLQPVSPAPPMGMNWMLQPWKDGTLVAHEGGTGGFSSLVAMVPGKKRAVVILSDTSLTAVGGLGSLGMHLLDPSIPAPKARRRIDAPDELLAALEGEYVLGGGMAVRLWRKGGALWGQAAGQAAFELGHDSAGDFYPLATDALLSPKRQADGRHAFSWSQGGGVVQARRSDPSPKTAAWRPDVPTLRGYVGTYPLMPGFALAVTERGGVVYVQGTGQPTFPVEAVAKDVFVAAQVGAELRFIRDAAGRVIALELLQAGQVLRGERSP